MGAIVVLRVGVGGIVGAYDGEYSACMRRRVAALLVATRLMVMVTDASSTPQRIAITTTKTSSRSWASESVTPEKEMVPVTT